MVVFPRSLHAGDTGEDVVAVKRALIKWDKGHPNGVVINPTMGGYAVALLEDFQKAEKLEVDGIYGPLSHAKLTPFFDAYGASMMLQEQQILAAAARPRNKFLAVADATVAHEPLFDYTERLGDQPGERGYFRVAPLDWNRRYSCDCSQHYVGCGAHAGFSGIFHSEAATGSLLSLEHIKLADAQPGDGVIFVSTAHPEGVHITILRARLSNGDWRVINMGAQGQPRYDTLSGEQAGHPGTWQVVVRLPA